MDNDEVLARDEAARDQALARALSAFNDQGSAGPSHSTREQSPSGLIDTVDDNAPPDNEEEDYLDPCAVPTADEVSDATRQVQTTVAGAAPQPEHRMLELPEAEDPLAHRERLFALTEPLTLSPDEYNTWWPWVERFWTAQDVRPKKKLQCIARRYRCRLFRKQLLTKGEGKRNKLITNALLCPITMTIMEYYRVTATDAEGIESREPVRFVFEKTGKGVDLEHNHDLLTLDDFKRSKRMLESAANFVAQGFSAADVFNALRADDKPQIHKLFLNAGGGPLARKDIVNVGAAYRAAHPDLRLGGRMTPATGQVDQLRRWCIDERLPHQHVRSRRRKDGGETEGFAFGWPARLQVLRTRGWLTLCDATHNTNTLGWKLFTLMIRDGDTKYLPCAHFLTSGEDADIIRDCMIAVQELTEDAATGTRWQPSFVLTDDSAAEQLAIKEAFSYETEHILCHKHLDTTYRKRFAGPRYKGTLDKLIETFKYKDTKKRFDTGIQQAINLLPGAPALLPIDAEGAQLHDLPEQFVKDRAYLKREVLDNWQLVSFAARAHSQLLMQVLTTNGLESFHSALKHGTKDRMTQYTLRGAAMRAGTIAQRYEHRAQKAARITQRMHHPRSMDYPWLRRLPRTAQTLVADELKFAEKELGPDFMSYVSFDNPTQCRCRFFLRFTLPCRHIWGMHMAYPHILPLARLNDFAAQFGSGGFEIYEGNSTDHLDCLNDDQYARRAESTRLEVRDATTGIMQSYYDLIEKDLGGSMGDPDYLQNVQTQFLQLLHRAAASVTVEAAIREVDKMLPLPADPRPVMCPHAQLPPDTPLSTAIPRISQAPSQPLAGPSQKKGKKRVRDNTRDTQVKRARTGAGAGSAAGAGAGSAAGGSTASALS